MKRLLSIIMIVSLMLSLFSVSVFAQEQTENGYLYKDEFCEQFGYDPSSFYGYRELYYHHIGEEDEASSIDWVFVHCISEIWDSWGFTSYLLIGDRIIEESAIPRPFDIPYAVYDVEKDEFIGIKDIDYNQYEGILECLQELNIGLLVGDVDRDKALTVVDATIIQRCIAQLEEFPENDVCEKHRHSAVYGSEELAYYSDVDLDGERTILDATAIQRKLARIEDTATTE